MKRTPKPKRYEYHVTYDPTAKLWVCKVGGAVVAYDPERSQLVMMMAWRLKFIFEELGQHSELIIHRKDGTIGKGSSSRRTYGGTLWLNLGDSYARDPKKGGSGPGGKNGYGEGYTEATAVMAGRGAGGVLAPFGSGTKPKEKDLIGIPWRVAFALQDDGWVLRQEIVWAKPNPMPESVRDRCTKSHEQIFLFAKAEWSGPPPTAAEAVESAIAQGALK